MARGGSSSAAFEAMMDDEANVIAKWEGKTTVKISPVSVCCVVAGVAIVSYGFYKFWRWIDTKIDESK